MLVGLFIGLAGVLAVDRLRDPIWVAGDVTSMPALGSVRVRRGTSQVWYDQAKDDRRKLTIQAIRAGVAGRMRARSGSVTIASDRLKPIGLRTTAADLAASFAQAGRSVVLVDADFSSSDPMAELPAEGLTLAKLVVDLRAGVAPDLGDIRQVRRGLWAISSGSVDEDPGDVLAGDALDRAIEALRGQFDLVIVSAGDVSSTVAQEIVSRTDGAILVAAAGSTRARYFDLLAGEFALRGAGLLGAVIVTKPSLPFIERIRYRLAVRRGDVVPVETMGRSDVSEPAVVVAVSEEAGAAMVQSITAPTEERRPPRDGLEVRTPERVEEQVVSNGHAVEQPVADAFLAGLAHADPERAYGPVADFIVDLAEQILMRPRALGFEHDGMLPLHPVKDRTTVGAAITSHLRDDLGAREGTAVERQIIDVLFGAGPLKKVPVLRKSLDAWLSVAFFRVHLARTSREPRVLHLVSPNRFFQIMVDAHRFDAEHVSRLSDDVLPLFIDDVERQQRAAKKFGSEEAIAQLDRAVVDARTLEIQLGWLLTGSDERSQLYYPWLDGDQPTGWAPRWEEDVRGTLAPLQRLGLLSVPVLTDEELTEFARLR
jgi:Mrp family chromosome partitioning ATPase